jgi:hypothetical protein
MKTVRNPVARVKSSPSLETGETNRVPANSGPCLSRPSAAVVGRPANAGSPVLLSAPPASVNNTVRVTPPDRGPVGRVPPPGVACVPPPGVPRVRQPERAKLASVPTNDPPPVGRVPPPGEHRITTDHELTCQQPAWRWQSGCYNQDKTPGGGTRPTT